MLVVDWLWPRQARQAAQCHNRLYHSGVPTAHIDVDEKSIDIEELAQPPRYKVTCPKCKCSNTEGDF